MSEASPSAPELRARASGELPNDSMIAQLAQTLRPLLDLPYIRRTRRNHALEHAAIHMLSGKLRDLRVAGRSDDHGFIVLGDVPTEQLEEAVRAALSRLQHGERNLALHPNCGTNLVVTAGLATLAAMVGFAFAKPKDMFNRAPMVMVGMMFAYLFGQPVGMSLQRHITTEGDPGDLELVSVKQSSWRMPLSGDAPIVVHRVTTRGG